MSLLREIKNLINISIREPALLFWNMGFPLILMSIMVLAFSGLSERTEIPLAVSPDFPATEIYEDIPVLKVSIMGEEEAKEKLLEGDLDGYIDRKGELHVRGTSNSSSFLYRIQKEIVQVGALYQKGYEPSVERVVKIAEEDTNIMVVFVSAVLAMTSVYSYYFGMNFMLIYQANLSNLALRLSTTPMKKSVQILAGFITGILFNMIINFVCLFYLKFVLNMDFLQDPLGTILILLAANFFGMGMGIFIGAANKFSENVKVMLGITITMIFGITAGMMADTIKPFLLEKAPLLMKYNPGNIVSTTLYRMNFLGSRQGLTEGILTLVALGLIFYGLSFRAIRRRRYDSI